MALMPIAGTALLGAVLNQCGDRVDQVVDNARQGALQVAGEGGIQLRRVIDNARVAYAENLNLTMEGIDQLVRGRIERLATLIDRAQNVTVEMFREMGEMAQQVANALPLHNARPQLRSVSPPFVL